MSNHKAKVGDKIIITNSFTDGVDNGEIHKVIELFNVNFFEEVFYGVEIDKCDEYGNIWIDEMEYELYKEVN